ncbi:PREDICTED: activating signal cointegrator 1 isoform X1 [Nanorana parkeri]|uniref:activating signal cointegrator 1 isoform X1 n=1 Tax=Nanorana parkeri TaxID=125878 RepID=UPI0008541544|nr:PREDICTED: activating signal cointegrator 1 isoform X1 [Nanorana parkeri]
MADNLLSWCVGELESRFGLSVSEDIVRYILSIDTEEEIEEYVNDLIQGSEDRKQTFIRELKHRWQRTKQPSSSNSAQISRNYDGNSDADFLFLLGTEVSESPLVIDQSKRGRRKGRNKMEPLPVHALTDTAVEEVKTPMDLAKAQETASLSSSKKKQKYVNLYTKEGQDRLTVLIPGRHPCECLAQKHKLINNCMTCGRIVCEQEGSGPCLFCGSLVCTKEEQDILMRDSNKSQKLRKKLMGGKMDVSSNDLLPHQEVRMKEGLDRALQHRDKLLEYDKTSVRRTHVIDDESDYFSTDSNQWLSTAERETLRKKEQELQELRHASRLSRKITIDFAGRQVFEEGDELAEYHKRFDENVHAINSGTIVNPVKKPGENRCDSILVNPSLMLSPPVWMDQLSAGSSRRQTFVEATAENTERNRLRIQDRELQEIGDQGMCLSMHQPWASLLVAGIKRVEGRTWYSAHRGRLWIAAAAKRPSPQEISELEASYRVLLNKDIHFPKDYPTGCLLGCVEVVDCLSREQFQEQYRSLNQESASPFVFICTNPQELPIKFPMKGQHKIWKLDSKIHQGAKKGILFRKEKMAQP